MARTRIYSTAVALLCAFGAAAGAAPSAQASDATFCFDLVNPGSPCPSYYGGVRHTYKNARTSWSTSISPGCGVYIGQGMVLDVDPRSAPPPPPKYAAQGYCYITDYFPNNTQLLRGFSQNLSNSRWQLVGNGGY